MSMQTPFAIEIPEETCRLVEPLLAADSVYRLVGNEIDQVIGDEDFVDMYATEGRPAVNPVGRVWCLRTIPAVPFVTSAGRPSSNWLGKRKAARQ